MKCTEIFVGNSSDDRLTWNQFLASPQAKGLLGKLLIALVAETAWSGEYTIRACLFGNSPELLISEVAYQIVIDKARAAVVATFPEARGATYIPCQASRHELYAFAQDGIENMGSNPLYVAQVMDDEVVGSVARLETTTVYRWYQMTEGQRFECFRAGFETKKPVNLSLTDRHMTP